MIGCEAVIWVSSHLTLSVTFVASDWQSLSPQFIDGSPDGLASALCFFSHAAFQFYLPAYLIADADGLLERVDPVYFLTHGKERASPSSLSIRNRCRRDVE